MRMNSTGPPTCTMKPVSAFRSFNIKQWFGRLRIAERYFPQASFYNKLFTLWFSLSGFNGALNLLFHPLHVVVSPTIMPSATHSIPATGLEEVGLGKLTGWLVWVLPRSASNLGVNLIVKVLCKSGFWSLLVKTTCSSHQLLQLNSSDEILVLWCHETVVL